MNDQEFSDGLKLRQQVEEHLRKQAPSLTAEQIAALPPSAVVETFHELQVHQIELEMQNEELRRAQAERDVMRARYFDLYDLAPVGYLTLSDKDVIREANLAAATRLGVPKSQLVGRLFFNFISPTDTDQYFLFFQKLLATGQPQVCGDLQIRSRAGAKFWASLQGNLTTDATGAAVINLIVSDLTTRKRADAELQAAKEQAQQKTALLQSIMESPKSVIIFALDQQYRYTGYTPLHQATMRKIWGREIAVGLNMLEVISDPVDRDKAQTNFDRTLRGEHLLIVEEYGDSSCDRVFYENRYSPILDQSGAVVGLTVFVIDISERQRAELELQEKEESYRTLADSGSALIWTAGRDKKCDYFNQPWLKFTGRTLDQELGDGWTEGVHPDDLARCVEIYTEAFDRRASFSLDYRLRRHDGEYRWIEDVGTPRQDSGGNFLGYIGHCLDISERKQAEAALRLQSSALEAAANAIIITDPTGNVIWANRALTTLTGYAVREVLGQSLRVLKSGEQDAAFYRQLWETICAGQVWTGELINKRKDGSLYTEEMTITPVRMEQGAITHFIAIKQDITVRKQAEAERLKTEQRFRSYFELPLVGLAITSPEKGWLDVNDRLCEMLGYSRAELLGMTWAELTAPADLAADVAQFDRLMARAIESYQLEKRFVHKDGQFISTELAVQCVRTATGAVDYIVALVQDISKRKQAFAELQRAQQQLVEQERLRAVGQLAAGIAHDFNNTLSPIVGFSELLLKDPAKRTDPVLLVQWLQFINTAATDAASVVRQIRELSHAPAPDALRVPVDLNQLIPQIIASTQPRWKNQAQGEGRTLNIVAQCGPIPLVTGEEYALREALTNLLFNAVDFTPDGGTITLGTAVDGEFVRCWVSDTGAGMTEETREHCLEPFFTTKGPKGTGLGLAMVQSIAQRYDGTVAIASALGQGTTVTLRLPIPIVQPAVPTRDAAAPVPQVLHVLVVDDEPLLCVLVEAWLTADGHRVATSTSGAAALQRLQTESFDLVITDKAMPKMGGEQLAVAIQAVAPALPVILMTGFGDLMKASGKMPPHISAILCKPITEASLREALAKVFPPQATD